MANVPMPEARTLGQLKASGYTPRTIRDEMRANLIAAIRRGETSRRRKRLQGFVFSQPASG